MVKLAIPAGAVVVIVPNRKAAAENRQRSAANGQRFIPPWHCFIHGPRESLASLAASPAIEETWNHHDDADVVTYLVGAFGWNLKGGAIPAHSFGRVPYAWAPRPLADALSAWVYGDKGATLETEQPNA